MLFVRHLIPFEKNNQVTCETSKVSTFMVLNRPIHASEATVLHVRVERVLAVNLATKFYILLMGIINQTSVFRTRANLQLLLH